MSKLLINEPPLQVLPTLAKEIGLNEAIALQQLHYWLKHGIWHKGQKWIYKPVHKWQSQDFPFWSEKTIRNVFKSLEKQDLILIDKLHSNRQVRVNYYSINNKELQKIAEKIGKANEINDWVILTECIWQYLPLPFGKAYHFHTVKLTSCIWKDLPNVKESNKEKNKEKNKDTSKGGVKKTKFNPFEYEIPSFIDKELWQAYHEMREIAKKPATENACKRLVSKLTKWNKKGLDVNPAIEASLIANWTDVYEEKAVSNSQPTNKKANSDLPAWQQTYVPPTFNANDIQRPVELSEEEKKRASEQLKQARQEFLL